MSSRPSAFDALMSNARAAGKKKTQSQSSPSKKRKTQEPNTSDQIPKISPNPKIRQNPNSDEIQLSNEPKQEQIENSNQLQDKPNPRLDDKLAVKKPRLISADESITQLKKKAANFDPKEAACWGDGEKVPFLFLARVFDAILKETGRIAITEIVCNMLRTVIQTSPDDLVPVVYLLANKIAPAHEGLELGIGEASIIKALAEACGRREAQIKKQYEVMGKIILL